MNPNISAIVIAPGCGEFVYSTDVIQDSHGHSLNMHLVTNDSYANTMLESLKQNLPSVKKVIVTVGWFADSKDSSNMTIEPRAEHVNAALESSWAVGHYNRSNPNTKIVQAWGGTPSDESLFQLVQALHGEGIEVTLAPMLFIDDSDKSWRGHIAPHNIQAVEHFFCQYHSFVSHYAGMALKGCKLSDMLDGFVVGSELVNLLRFDDGSHSYPAVERMCQLVHAIKSLVGEDVQTIYAANWDEFDRHPDGYYSLDKLWSCVDKIGIDSYFPLVEEGVAWDQDAIVHGWAKVYASLKHWYGEYHFNPDGRMSCFEPGCKPVIATEIGFCAHPDSPVAPYKFYSNSEIKALGLHPDKQAQKEAMAGTLKYFAQVHSRGEDDEDVPHLLPSEDLYWYCVDIRGDGVLHSQYADYEEWGVGHNIA